MGHAKRHPLAAFSYALPVSALAGLVGVGGAEFRLPVLVGALGYSARQAVPLNLAVSTATLFVALITRSRALAVQPLVALAPAVFALLAGSVTSAVFGVRLARRLSDDKIERVVRVLLVLVGIALISGGVSTWQLPTLLPPGPHTQTFAGLFCGAAVGMIGSLAGVGGGQLMIPTMVFIFGADIKTAGTASLLINFPTVIALVLRYAQSGAYSEGHAMSETVLPMGTASCVGAFCGGLLASAAPVRALKVALGMLLVLSALRVFGKKKRMPLPGATPDKLSVTTDC